MEIQLKPEYIILPPFKIAIFSSFLLKSLQNKKGQKNLRYPTKKLSFSKEKDCFIVGYLKLFWPFLFWNEFNWIDIENFCKLQ